MKKLRLLLFEKCNRQCVGCCNKDYDLKTLPYETEFGSYDEVNITGGEPLLDWISVVKTAELIRRQGSAMINLYTAKLDNLSAVIVVLGYVDGMTVTLHEQSDVADFEILNKYIFKFKPKKSLRVNIFKGVSVDFDLSAWVVKKDIVWIKNCPLPKDEVLKKMDERVFLENGSRTD